MRYQLGVKLFLFSGLPDDFLGCHSLDLLPQGCWYLFAFCLVVGGCSLWSVVTRAVAPQERWQDNQFDCRPSWPGLPPYPSRHCPALHSRSGLRDSGRWVGCLERGLEQSLLSGRRRPRSRAVVSSSKDWALVSEASGANHSEVSRGRPV